MFLLTYQLVHQKIYIIGMPGVGKTTFGKELASRLNISFVDLDNYIEETQDQPIEDIFKAAGEDMFRNIEAHALRSYSQLNHSFVMACGGGTPCYSNNLEYIKNNGISLYYTQTIDTIAKQLTNDSSIRPLLKNISADELPVYLNKLLKKREPYYMKANAICNSIDSATGALNSLSVTQIGL
jgi:shikimate kinase